MNRSDKPVPPPVPFSVSGAVDSHPARRIVRLVEDVGVRKARTATVPLLVLSVLAGVYIAFGAMLYTVILPDSGLGAGLGRWVAGFGFAVGLMLVLVAGAELFTGNMLIVMAWADHRVTGAELRRNWAIVYAGNLAGGVLAAWAVDVAGIYRMDGGAAALTAVRIAEAKVALEFWPALMRGVLCNLLVCLAVWLCFASQSVTDRILSILFPVATFVALGFEHSVANMYLIPAGMLHGADTVSIEMFLRSLIPVTIGNMIGGGVLVAGVYWVVYLVPWPGGGSGND